MMEDCDVALLGQGALVREGLRHILAQNDFNIVFSGDDPGQLSETVFDDNPAIKIILLDDGQDGFALACVKSISDVSPDIRVVILADRLDVDAMVEAFRLGVHGYIIKNIGCDALLNSLRLVANGERVLPGGLVDRLFDLPTEETPNLPQIAMIDESLTARENEILRCLTIGMPNKVVARRLDVSEATVKVHVKGILRKLGVNNRTQAAIYALSKGLVNTSLDMQVEGAVEGNALGWRDAWARVGEADTSSQKIS